jgi:polyribonucleotide nucleotidyltransferase
MPFLGPVGAVRVGMNEHGDLTVNPTLQEQQESPLDLLVVGTKDALTMVECGANEIPEERLLEAFELAHNEIRKLCEAQEELARQAGKPKWLDLELAAEIERGHGHAVWERIQQVGLKDAGAIVEEILDQLCPPISMESTDDDITKQLQTRAALQTLLEKQRTVAVEGQVREQFENDLRALTDAEQDSKQLKSAKRHLLFEHIA